ncbi:MAG TPA: ABC transporter ATP-binding protein [Armatimonadota bacterium]|jgi:ABC-2 type transport system ATP-binding protein
MGGHEADPSVPVVEIKDLTRRFGSRVALDHVSLDLYPGSVLGLVGQNGAGKTTLIKHVLGLLRAHSGSVRVFGKDPVKDPVGVLSRLGYLSEEEILPPWMRVSDLLRYVRALYPTWDDAYAERLREQFELSPASVIRSLSKGQRARAGLLVALAYRPELLVLDEPSSGLDPIVRRDILAAVIRTIADEGRTVLFSSHLLGEVERVSDRVAMIREGRILFCDDLDDIRQSHFRVTLRFAVPVSSPPAMPGVLTWAGSGQEWTAVWSGRNGALEAEATALGAQVMEKHGASLDEIFMARAGASLSPAGED